LDLGGLFAFARHLQAAELAGVRLDRLTPRQRPHDERVTHDDGGQGREGGGVGPRIRPGGVTHPGVDDDSERRWDQPVGCVVSKGTRVLVLFKETNS